MGDVVALADWRPRVLRTAPPSGKVIPVSTTLAPTPIDAALIGHRVSVVLTTTAGERIRHGWLKAASDEDLFLTTGKLPGRGADIDVPRGAVKLITHIKLDCTCHRNLTPGFGA